MDEKVFCEFECIRLLTLDTILEDFFSNPSDPTQFFHDESKIQTPGKTLPLSSPAPIFPSKDAPGDALPDAVEKSCRFSAVLEI